jgi:hypothetical protein
LKQIDQFGDVPMQATVPDAFVGGGHIVSYAFWKVRNGVASLPFALSLPFVATQ